MESNFHRPPVRKGGWHRVSQYGSSFAYFVLCFVNNEEVFFNKSFDFLNLLDPIKILKGEYYVDFKN
jgi:hypothetical protein